MGRALAVSLPLFVLYSASGDANWLLANIATISVAVVVERVGSAPLAALGQGVAIILGFLGLSFALAWGAAFAIACAALAAAAVALSGLDTRLRTLGNFVLFLCSIWPARLPRRTALRCPWCRISSSRRYHRWRSPVSIPCATQRSHAVTAPCCAGVGRT